MITHADGKQMEESPSPIRAVSIVSVASLMAFRGLLFATTDFKTSTQCFAFALDLSGVS